MKFSWAKGDFFKIPYILFEYIEHSFFSFPWQIVSRALIIQIGVEVLCLVFEIFLSLLKIANLSFDLHYNWTVWGEEIWGLFFPFSLRKSLWQAPLWLFAWFVRCVDQSLLGNLKKTQLSFYYLCSVSSQTLDFHTQKVYTYIQIFKYKVRLQWRLLSQGVSKKKVTYFSMTI